MAARTTGRDLYGTEILVGIAKLLDAYIQGLESSVSPATIMERRRLLEAKGLTPGIIKDKWADYLYTIISERNAHGMPMSNARIVDMAEKSLTDKLNAMINVIEGTTGPPRIGDTREFEAFET